MCVWKCANISVSDTKNAINVKVATSQHAKFSASAQLWNSHRSSTSGPPGSLSRRGVSHLWETLLSTTPAGLADTTLASEVPSQ